MKEGVFSKTTGKQFVKFAFVGGLNTAVDLGVLNLLMWFFNIYQGLWIIVFNFISVSLAIINSYFFNKYWTFGVKKREGQAVEFASFVAVSLGGALINTLVVYSATTYFEPQFGLSKELWANFGKIVAIGLAWLWNFAGYKFFVFKR